MLWSGLNTWLYAFKIVQHFEVVEKDEKPTCNCKVVKFAHDFISERKLAKNINKSIDDLRRDVESNRIFIIYEVYLSAFVDQFNFDFRWCRLAGNDKRLKLLSDDHIVLALDEKLLGILSGWNHNLIEQIASATSVYDSPSTKM